MLPTKYIQNHPFSPQFKKTLSGNVFVYNMLPHIKPLEYYWQAQELRVGFIIRSLGVATLLNIAFVQSRTPISAFYTNPPAHFTLTVGLPPTAVHHQLTWKWTNSSYCVVLLMSVWAQGEKRNITGNCYLFLIAKQSFPNAQLTHCKLGSDCKLGSAVLSVVV